VLVVPADGTRLPTVATETSVRRRFFLGQLSGKLLLARTSPHGVPRVKRNGGSNECEHPPQAIPPQSCKCQLRSIRIFVVWPQVLHASESSSNAPPNRTGVMRVMTISVSHVGHIDEVVRSGGNCWPTT
jgi:hypothetical protein